MIDQDFSVDGQRVLVVGAARSGVAAAHLLARRGARVTLTDVKPEIPNQSELSSAGIDLELGGHLVASFESADLVVMMEPTANAIHDLGLQPESVLVRRSTLEDVFLHLTGRTLIDE